SRRILVGYVATAAGRDALNLGITLAVDRDAELHVAMVAPEAEPYAAAVSQGAGYERVLRRQLQEWVDEAVASVPEGVRV
ncbi:universal stress protein, partial [Corynebacterium sp. UMB9976]|nr:universal stress protein [Corynebacterium sp. UMB9976]